jgi:hypothetical protein
MRHDFVRHINELDAWLPTHRGAMSGHFLSRYVNYKRLDRTERTLE